MHGAASVSSAGRGCARESARGYERLPMIVTDSQRPTRKRPIRERVSEATIVHTKILISIQYYLHSEGFGILKV